MTELYIGLMSGTSADGIDAALVDFTDNKPTLIATHYTPYHPALREKILALCNPGANEIERLGELDILLANEFASATNQLLKQQSLTPSSIKAIGSHGQTIRHMPHGNYRFTLQIGDPNTIAAKTGINTIADFRRKDMAMGGQGAPLVPAFHQHVFASDKNNRVIVNIGGIANITILSANNKNVSGYDTGPGNVLMDAWINQHHQQTHDVDGKWAATGQVSQILLTTLLSDPYFKQPAPKSTGREYFNLAWLEKKLTNITISPVDTQTTLTELTAQSIINSIRSHMTSGEIFICGGGARNQFLMTRLQQIAAPHFKVTTTETHGIHPDWVEAMAFAWLARQTMLHQTGNITSVTGAKAATILGGVYYAS